MLRGAGHTVDFLPLSPFSFYTQRGTGREVPAELRGCRRPSRPRLPGLWRLLLSHCGTSECPSAGPGRAGPQHLGTTCRSNSPAVCWETRRRGPPGITAFRCLALLPFTSPISCSCDLFLVHSLIPLTVGTSLLPLLEGRAHPSPRSPCPSPH